VVSFNIPVLLVSLLVVAWLGVKLWKAIAEWRKRLRIQQYLLQDRDKEIAELQNLWKVEPSMLDWKELLSRFFFFFAS